METAVMTKRVIQVCCCDNGVDFQARKLKYLAQINAADRRELLPGVCNSRLQKWMIQGGAPLNVGQTGHISQETDRDQPFEIIYLVNRA
jgi:hypothetical protein